MEKTIKIITIKLNIKFILYYVKCILVNGKKSAYMFKNINVNNDLINIVKSETFDKSKLDHICLKFCCFTILDHTNSFNNCISLKSQYQWELAEF